MKRCLEKTIKDKNLGISSITPGVYSQKLAEAIDVKKESKEVQMLDSGDIAEYIVDTVLKEENQKFSKQLIQDIYEVEKFKDR